MASKPLYKCITTNTRWMKMVFLCVSLSKRGRKCQRLQRQRCYRCDDNTQNVNRRCRSGCVSLCLVKYSAFNKLHVHLSAPCLLYLAHTSDNHQHQHQAPTKMFSSCCQLAVYFFRTSLCLLSQME